MAQQHKQKYTDSRLPKSQCKNAYIPASSVAAFSAL